MENIKSIIKRKNVSVDRNLINNVYNDVVASKIEEALDKPKAIGEEIANALNAPQNIKFYIKIAYLYPLETIFECLALTKEALREGRIEKSAAQYFWGILRRKNKK